MSQSLRCARVYAEALILCCPHCTEQLPCPDGTGSLMWTIEALQAASEDHRLIDCCCGKTIRLVLPARAMISLVPS